MGVLCKHGRLGRLLGLKGSRSCDDLSTELAASTKGELSSLKKVMETRHLFETDGMIIANQLKSLRAEVKIVHGLVLAVFRNGKKHGKKKKKSP